MGLGKPAAPPAGSAPADTIAVDVPPTKKPLATPTAPPSVPSASVLALFRFATPLDWFLVAASCVFGLGHGVAMPLFSLLFGKIVNSLNSPDLSSSIQELCLQMMGIAIAAGVSAYLQFALANVSAVRQVRALRSAYVQALLRQDLAWCDAHPPGELAARLTEDTVALEDAIGGKFSLISQSIATFLAGVVLAFSLSWKMSLVLLGFIPVLGIVMSFISEGLMGTDKKGSDSYALAGEVATEALSNIRTVAAYGGEAAVAARYDAALGQAEAAGVRKSALTGITVGTFLAVLFTVYGTCLLWGAQLVIWDRSNVACYNPTTIGCFTGGTVMQVLFALIMGAGALGQVAPSISALTTARAAAARMFEVLDRVPPIDSLAAAPCCPSSAATAATLPGRLGRIEFRNVTFAYPARPTVPVLKDFSLVIEAGERLALVGPSGCGKSTLVALLQRWYDVQSGAVLIDGVDVRTLPVQALRAGQALVSQESLLLAGSVAHNVRLGAVGEALPDAAVEAAARAANAHEFISALPGGYGASMTNTGLSGGQRQRLCIARALLRSAAPILLLDEATSALDSASEAAVQAALDALLVAGARTTVTIAHRLSTIDGSDRVVVLNDGAIVEQGAPGELMAKPGGIFRAMRLAQGEFHAGGATEATPRQETPRETGATTAANSSAPGATTAAKSKEEAGAAPSALLAPGEPEPPPVSWARLARYNAPEVWWFVLGLLACAVTGLTMPAFSLILSRFISIFFNPDNEQLWRDAIFYMCMFFLIAGGNFVACVLQQYSFGILGERLVRRVRSAAFSSLLRFEINWHDLHPAGSVTAALGADAYLLRGATGPTLALNIQNALGMVAGLAIAFNASWRITLVVLAVAPLLGVGGALQLKMLTGSSEAAKKAFEECGAVATEALSAPRTVAAYGLQAASLAAFTTALDKPTRANFRNAWASGIGMGLMALVMVGSYAIIFGVGSVFIQQGVLTFQDLLTAMFGVMFAAMGLGQGSGMAGDTAKAAMAKRSLFALIDRVPRGGRRAGPGEPQGPRARGALSLRGVRLSYPGREATPALAGVDLDIPAGSFVALVGASGSGKSSIVSLLLRFYEPSAGSLLLDGVDMASLPLEAVRSQLAWVQQEPSLFNSSVAYNIGFPDVAPLAPEDAELEAAAGAPPAPPPPAAIAAAAAAAGAHDFVSALPRGYDTPCGTRGSQLSGGQKQRICIARALLRDAPVLLLDEATSALDSASEAQVQEAVNALLEKERGRATVLVIAHRLSTVKQADLVVVMGEGAVLEAGSWAQLASKEGGAFAAMLAMQGLAA